jgi:hypothetical protein
MTWQTMESAPKDERVIVYATLRGDALGGHDRGKDYGKHVVIAAFDTHYGFWIDGSQCTPEPTYWMPLPPCPGPTREPMLPKEDNGCTS